MIIRKNGIRTALCLLALPLVILSAGCGKEDDEEVAPTELEGTWATACIAKKDGDDNIESHTKMTLVLTKDAVNATQSEYAATDTTCAGAQQYTVESTGTYVVGAEVTTPAGAKALDTTPTKVTVTLKTADMVTAFNAGSFCGDTDWALNTAKDVTTKTCGKEGDPAMNAVSYDIYDVDGTTLKTGDMTGTADGSTAAKRPTALSTEDDVYTKQ